MPLEPPEGGSGTLNYGGPKDLRSVSSRFEDDEGGGHRVEQRAHEEVEEHEEHREHEEQENREDDREHEERGDHEEQGEHEGQGEQSAGLMS